MWEHNQCVCVCALKCVKLISYSDWIYFKRTNQTSTRECELCGYGCVNIFMILKIEERIYTKNIPKWSFKMLFFFSIIESEYVYTSIRSDMNGSNTSSMKMQASIFKSVLIISIRFPFNYWTKQIDFFSLHFASLFFFIKKAHTHTYIKCVTIICSVK